MLIKSLKFIGEDLCKIDFKEFKKSSELNKSSLLKS